MKVNINKQAGAMLRAIIKGRNVHQGKLSKKLDMAQSNLNRRLEGLYPINLQQLQKFSKELSLEFIVNKSGIKIKELPVKE